MLYRRLCVLIFVLCTVSTCKSRMHRSKRSQDSNGSSCSSRAKPCCLNRNDGCTDNVGSSCYCDEYCVTNGDCCSDYSSVCQGPISDTCLKCMCNQESGCRPLNCSLDVNAFACGYFQLHYTYYQDCHEPKPVANCSKSIDCWRECSKEYECSARCVRTYTARYDNRNYAGSNCEIYARLHNGGPNGANKKRSSAPNYDSTTGYWNKVKNQGCTINS